MLLSRDFPGPLEPRFRAGRVRRFAQQQQLSLDAAQLGFGPMLPVSLDARLPLADRGGGLVQLADRCVRQRQLSENDREQQLGAEGPQRSHAVAHERNALFRPAELREVAALEGGHHGAEVAEPLFDAHCDGRFQMGIARLRFPAVHVHETDPGETARQLERPRHALCECQRLARPL